MQFNWCRIQRQPKTSLFLVLDDKSVVSEQKEASKTLDSINTCIDFKSEENDIRLMEALLFLVHLRREEDEIDQARLVLNQVVGLYLDEEFEEEPDAFDLDHLLECTGGRHRLYSDTVLCQIKRQVAFLLGMKTTLKVQLNSLRT